MCWTISADRKRRAHREHDKLSLHTGDGSVGHPYIFCIKVVKNNGWMFRNTQS